MNITKYGHACLFIDNGNSRLVIDPGDFTDLPQDLKNVSVIVVTEEHYDHFDPSNIKKILEQSPDAKIYSTANVAEQLNNESISAQSISSQEVVDYEGKKIKLTEGDHAVVYGQSPCKVLTVTVGDFLYYPSDSFIETKDKVKILALPTSGPWHKLSEAIDLMKSTNCEIIIATHNGLNSQDGNKVSSHFLNLHSKEPVKNFIYLEDGQSQDFSD